jgi:F-type H+-transporting ATPase subunit gamma
MASMFVRSGFAPSNARRTTLQPKNEFQNTLSPFGLNGGAQEASKLKEVRARIKSVKSIEKITKTMKMIASSRLKAAQTKMEKNRPFYDGASKILSKIPVDTTKTNLVFAVTADRGLCGAINSSIAKQLRLVVNERKPSGAQFRLVPMGDKSTQLLVREFGSRVAFGVGDLSKKGFNFAGTSVVVDRILEQETFDNVTVIYNKFVSAISYSQEVQDIPSPAAFLESKELYDYEFEEDQRIFHTRDLFEFEMANLLYHAFCENSAAELGARMAAMDSASRNATEMLKALNIAYNRGRQAAITTELTEIISGASAVE